MNTYHRIMEWFWLATTVLIIIAVSIMGFLNGFERWVFYYVFALLSAMTYLMRRYMRKRMEKHMKWLEEQKQQPQ